MLRTEDILAIVVSYNGSRTIAATVQSLKGQVGQIYIVDNGSDVETREALDVLHLEADVSIALLNDNRGIGYALNLGVERARRMGYQWLLTMDQDSVVDGSMIREYQIAVERDPGLTCLSPTIAGSHRAGGAVSCSVTYAITSGNLVRVCVFGTIGLYDEGFFIDCIDFDFSLRLRRAGYVIHRISRAVMHHQLGEAVNVPGFVRKFYALHRPARRYYMYRNYMYMVERYLLRFPKFVLKLGVLQLVLAILIGFYDTEPRMSYRAIISGIKDYGARKDGPYVERAR